jgi:hypothetical protein
MSEKEKKGGQRLGPEVPNVCVCGDRAQFSGYAFLGSAATNKFHSFSGLIRIFVSLCFVADESENMNRNLYTACRLSLSYLLDHPNINTKTKRLMVQEIERELARSA